jgi:hypothetical protein
MTEDRLSMALRHVESGRRIVANQKKLIERLRHDGYRTDSAESLLRHFATSQKFFEKDLLEALTGTGPILVVAAPVPESAILRTAPKKPA